MSRSVKEYVIISLKGIGMGAADIVPGVSGGTVALITGIYEEFIDSLKSFTGVFQVLLKEGWSAAWKHINGNFLFSLFLGIFISVLSLAQLIKYALHEHPIQLWSFFFGLILISSYYVGKQVKEWNLINGLTLFAGAVFIFILTSMVPAETSNAYWFVFLAGMLAICAMILPGISGAFILVLLGKYNFVIESASPTDFNLGVLTVFALGCGFGLLSFSHLLSLMLKKHHDLTIALLTGFMIGSLNKIWPWKHTLEWGIDRHGEQVARMQENVLPQHFSEGDNQFVVALILFIIAIVFMVLMERWALSKKAT